MVHVFSTLGYKIALDVNSGSIHILDDISYIILKEFNEFPSFNDVYKKLNDRYTSNEIKDTYEEIETLKDEGLLYSEDFIEDLIANRKNDNDRIKALCLHVAHDCNLRCEYCFASKGDYKTGRSLMPLEVALKSVDYLVENSGNLTNIEIDFFGGEPLLNFDVVKGVVRYGRKLEKTTGKKFFFTITTNGSLLNNEIINFINENMDNIVISLDGRKEVHDSIRYKANGKGSYDEIVDGAKRLVANRGNKDYFIRGTFTSRNLDFSEDVFHLADLGFKEISVEPVVGSGDELFIQEKHIPIILEEYENLAKRYIERLSQNKPFRFYHFYINLYEGPCIYKRVTACGAGYEYLAVSPEGDIYPCHQFVGEENFKIGNIYNGIVNNKLKQKFKKNNVFSKQKCRECWAKYFCSGGCHANAYFSNGNINKPDDIACILQKKRIECAIAIKAAETVAKI